MSIQQAAEKWVIPSDAKKPTDARIKSGKYIKGKDGVESDH